MTYQKLIWINVPIEKEDGAGERYDILFTGDLHAQLSAGPDETSGGNKGGTGQCSWGMICESVPDKCTIRIVNCR